MYQGCTSISCWQLMEEVLDIMDSQNLVFISLIKDFYNMNVWAAVKQLLVQSCLAFTADKQLVKRDVVMLHFEGVSS